jgi:hypothetical protein
MDENTTILDLIKKMEEEELDFLPEDEDVREGFMAFMKFIILAV